MIVPRALAGACAIVVGLVLQFAPIWDGFSIPTVAGVCSGLFGALAQSSSSSAAAQCIAAHAGDIASWVLLGAGALLLTLSLLKKKA